jgi:hypothetical protein
MEGFLMSTYTVEKAERDQKAWRLRAEGKDPERDCFIATVCYRDTDAPELIALRKWRDCVLSKRISGRAFIRIYYRFGPSLANQLEKHPSLQPFVRGVIDRHVHKVQSQYK